MSPANIFLLNKTRMFQTGDWVYRTLLSRTSNAPLFNSNRTHSHRIEKKKGIRRFIGSHKILPKRAPLEKTDSLPSRGCLKIRKLHRRGVNHVAERFLPLGLRGCLGLLRMKIEMDIPALLLLLWDPPSALWFLTLGVDSISGLFRVLCLDLLSTDAWDGGWKLSLFVCDWRSQVFQELLQANELSTLRRIISQWARRMPDERRSLWLP